MTRINLLPWREQQRKSEIAVTATTGDTPGQTLYTGLDTMRSPFRFGFAIGLSLGPLPAEAGAAVQALELAGQQGLDNCDPQNALGDAAHGGARQVGEIPALLAGQAHGQHP